ncbi:hypothetical protein QC762_307225 [Podospora pseudocomata]|uniref:Cyanovirin-N domain-containing protein n=1 Tax=Podospora pseudocomata TaxID=2093779 RepID=A0ABR0GJQ0_9PEZI|nr:hypothetical protein QC762_307225 [Podospora pseudocomata]
MKFLATLLTLAASASAIDLYLHTDNNCGGSNALRCNGINPNTCCGTNANGSPYQSVAVRGIQQGWNIQCRGYDNGQCNRLQTISGNNGGNFICNRSNGFRYSGVGYNFIGRKRAIDSPLKPECQRPNALVLEDGSEFDLTGLSEEEFDALWVFFFPNFTDRTLIEVL